MAKMRQYRQHYSREVLTNTLYGLHVQAMTAEDLYSKGEIAEELAWRDMQIKTLQDQLEAVLVRTNFVPLCAELDQDIPEAWMSSSKKSFVHNDHVGDSVPNWTDYYTTPLYTKPQKTNLETKQLQTKIDLLQSRLSGALLALKDFLDYVPKKDWKPYWQQVLDENDK